ncbi:MAG: hypothetical protein M3P48_11250 [Actinomycetota bacterium]|nr:hypothetical protein [Actinomycetota bacterium]
MGETTTPGGPTGTRSWITLLHGSPRGSWSTRATGVEGTPLAIADDGRTTFIVYTPALQGLVENESLRIFKVPHGGRVSPSRLLDGGRRLHRGEPTSASFLWANVVARDGRWWAVWKSSYEWEEEQERGEDSIFGVVGCSEFYQARSVLPAFAARKIGTGCSDSLGIGLHWRGRTALLSQTASNGAVHLRRANASGQFESTGVTVTGAEEFSASVTVAGGGTFVSYVDARTGRLHLAQDDGRLRFTRRLIPSRGRPAGTTTYVAASGGRVFVGYDAGFKIGTPPRNTRRAYVATSGTTGPFRSREVTARFGARNPAIEGWVTGLVAARGRATVSFLVIPAPPNWYAARLP